MKVWIGKPIAELQELGFELEAAHARFARLADQANLAELFLVQAGGDAKGVRSLDLFGGRDQDVGVAAQRQIKVPGILGQLDCHDQQVPASAQRHNQSLSTVGVLQARLLLQKVTVEKHLAPTGACIDLARCLAAYPSPGKIVAARLVELATPPVAHVGAVVGDARVGVDEGKQPPVGRLFLENASNLLRLDQALGEERNRARAKRTPGVLDRLRVLPLDVSGIFQTLIDNLDRPEREGKARPVVEVGLVAARLPAAGRLQRNQGLALAFQPPPSPKTGRVKGTNVGMDARPDHLHHDLVHPGLEVRAQVVAVVFGKLGVKARRPVADALAVDPQHITVIGKEVHLGQLRHLSQRKAPSKQHMLGAARRKGRPDGHGVFGAGTGHIEKRESSNLRQFDQTPRQFTARLHLNEI